MDELRKLRAEIQNEAKARAAGAIKFRAEALARAKAGDWEPLGWYLQTSHLRRRGGVFTRDVRSFVCDVLLGKRRRPKSTKKFATERRKREAAEFIIRKRFRAWIKEEDVKDGSTIHRGLDEESKNWAEELADRLLGIGESGEENALKQAAKKFKKPGYPPLTARSISRYLAEARKNKEWVDQISAKLVAEYEEGTYAHEEAVWHALSKDGTMPRYAGVSRTPAHHGSPGDI
jgi:hypothetical protein